MCPSNGSRQSSSSLKHLLSKKRTYMHNWAVSVLSVDSSTAIYIVSAFIRSPNSVSYTSAARISTLWMLEVSDSGTFFIADATLVLILSSFITSSTTASIQSFTVSESVNGLFFFANIQETRRDAAVALSWAVNDRTMVVAYCSGCKMQSNSALLLPSLEIPLENWCGKSGVSQRGASAYCNL